MACKVRFYFRKALFLAFEKPLYVLEVSVRF